MPNVIVFMGVSVVVRGHGTPRIASRLASWIECLTFKVGLPTMGGSRGNAQLIEESAAVAESIVGLTESSCNVPDDILQNATSDLFC